MQMQHLGLQMWAGAAYARVLHGNIDILVT